MALPLAARWSLGESLHQRFWKKDQRWVKACESCIDAQLEIVQPVCLPLLGLKKHFLPSIGMMIPINDGFSGQERSGNHHHPPTGSHHPFSQSDSTGCKRCFLALIRAAIFVSATSALLYLQVWWATESLGRRSFGSTIRLPGVRFDEVLFLPVGWGN